MSKTTPNTNNVQLYVHLDLSNDEIECSRKGGLISRDWCDIMLHDGNTIPWKYMRLGDLSQQGFLFTEAHLTPHGLDIMVHWPR